jgi:hypothetical protein
MAASELSFSFFPNFNAMKSRKLKISLGMAGVSIAQRVARYLMLERIVWVAENEEFEQIRNA